MSGIPPERLPGADGNDRRDWAGFAEIDQAIREDRLTEYRCKKAWADLWNRRLLIFIFVVLAVFVAWVIYEDLIMK